MMGRPSNRKVGCFAILIFVMVLVFLFPGRILWAMGSVMVDAESPRKADLVVVLGGDAGGRRVVKGAELVREGYAPKMLISSGPIVYGRPESELAADYAVSHGYDRGAMICFTRPQHSTAEEAFNLGAIMRKMGVHSALLVTSPSHTARAARLFRARLPEMEIHPVAAPDPAWCGGRWWTARECEKTWFLEAVKTVTGPFGL
jgi:uncharacterized SAM-binding protein YcdF (DUF218 family)